MMTIKPDEANRVLVIETHGMISEADIDGAFADLEDRYPQVSVRLRGGAGGPIGVFVDWQHLTGWERGAKTLGTITGKTLGGVVHKVAIVADEKWRDEVPRIADMGKQSEVLSHRKPRPSLALDNGRQVLTRSGQTARAERLRKQ